MEVAPPDKQLSLLTLRPYMPNMHNWARQKKMQQPNLYPLDCYDY